jgi:hypothetical protein
MLLSSLGFSLLCGGRARAGATPLYQLGLSSVPAVMQAEILKKNNAAGQEPGGG